MPDEELFRLAAAGKLRESLSSQLRRMIADAKAIGFVRNFAGQWLKVRDFSSVTTDRNRYRTYDDELRVSSQAEPLEFFKEVVNDDLSILNFVDSDFVVVDPLLAAHYGIDGVKGDGFRKVAVGPEHHRGGVLGMAGVLTYLTDGFRTLPVRRAAYVVDTLWNEPAKPPPPNAGDLPAVKRNLTVRQRLEQHRNSAACASCHTRLDPFGVALENYDAIGRWRTQDGKFPVDASGALPGGGAFRNVLELKALLLKDERQIARNLARQLAVYATGAPIRFGDRARIEGVLDRAPGFGVRSIIREIVASELFRCK